MSWAEADEDRVLRHIYEDNLIKQYIDVNTTNQPDFDLAAFQAMDTLDQLDLAYKLENEINRLQALEKTDNNSFQMENVGTAATSNAAPVTSEITAPAKKKRKSNTPKQVIDNRFFSDNKFTVLSDMETDNNSKTMLANMDPENYHAKNIQQQTSASTSIPVSDNLPSDTATNNNDVNKETCAQSETPAVTSAPVIPPAMPVVVYHIKEITKFANELEQVANFSLKATRDTVRILPKTLQDKTKIIDFLKARHDDFYIVPDVEYPLKAVIRGMPASTDIEIISEALTTCNFEINKVVRMTRRISGDPMPLFLIHLPKNKASEEIFKLTRLCHVIVKVEPYKPPRKAIQCFSCQSFFHVARDCNRKIACCRCGLAHDVKECEKEHQKINAPINLNCINCGGQHPASYKGCSKFANSTAIRKKPTTYAQAAQAKSTSPATYAAITSNQPRNPPPQHQRTWSKVHHTHELSSIATLTAELKAELKINSFSEITGLLRSTLEKVKAATSQEGKLLAFIESISLPERPFSGPLAKEPLQKQAYTERPFSGPHANECQQPLQVCTDRPFSGPPAQPTSKPVLQASSLPAWSLLPTTTPQQEPTQNLFLQATTPQQQLTQNLFLQATTPQQQPTQNLFLQATRHELTELKKRQETMVAEASRQRTIKAASNSAISEKTNHNSPAPSVPGN